MNIPKHHLHTMQSCVVLHLWGYFYCCQSVLSIGHGVLYKVRKGVATLHNLVPRSNVIVSDKSPFIFIWTVRLLYSVLITLVNCSWNPNLSEPYTKPSNSQNRRPSVYLPTREYPSEQSKYQTHSKRLKVKTVGE